MVRRGGNPACGVAPVGLQPVPLSHRSGISKRVMIIVSDRLQRGLALDTTWDWLFGNGDVSGWQGKRNRPCWKTSTERARRETFSTMRPVSPPLRGVGPLKTHPQGRWSSPGAARRSREKTTGSTWVHGVGIGPSGRLNVVGERHALPSKLHHFPSGGRALTQSQWRKVMGLNLREQKAKDPDQPRPVGDGTMCDHVGDLRTGRAHTRCGEAPVLDCCAPTF